MKEYQDVTFVPIEEETSFSKEQETEKQETEKQETYSQTVEEDTSFSKYKEEKRREGRRKSKGVLKLFFKAVFIFFALIFLSPIVLGSIFVVGGLGAAVVAGSVGVAIGGIVALILSVFLISSGWVSLGVFGLFVTMGCISVTGLMVSLCYWLLRSIFRLFKRKYMEWRYKEEVIEEAE